MNEDLKKAIIDYMFSHKKEFQLVNATVEKFRQYIYDETGEYCIGGKKVYEFILLVEDIISF